MSGGCRHRVRRGRLALIAILALSLSAPLNAVALDSDLKGSAVFRLEGTNGYTILGFASSERIGGRGDVGLIVYRKGATVVYAAPATVTPTRLDADLGALGRFSAEIVPSGRKKLFRGCDGEARRLEPRLYRGTFEFQGEEGYTEAVATDVLEYPQFFFDLICSAVAGGESLGRGLPGARLRAFSRHRDRSVSLQLNKNKPGGSTSFEATLKEVRNGIRIERTVTGRQPANAFEYDPLLRTATAEPAAPFSGVASFRRNAAAANRWTGTLSVDFPGKANVSVTGDAFSARMVHAQRRG